MFSQSSSNRFLQIETKSGCFLQELQKIWDEVGVPNVERDTMLLKIEQQCVDVFRTKVDEAEQCKAQLQQAIANCEAEFLDICAVLGEKPPDFDHKISGSLKKEFEIIIPQLEVMKKRKIERKDQFFSVLDQLQRLSTEISRSLEDNLYKMVVEETDLSLKRLAELHRQLLEYQDEKRNRLKLIMDHMSMLNSLCLVLGMDFKHTIHEIHPTLDDLNGEKDVTNSTIEGLANSVQILREVKIQRWQRLEMFASALLEMWNLMDTPMEEQKKFQNVTSRIAASESEITEPNILSVDLLNDVEAEVSKLEQLKSSKLKEILLKKKLELEEVCRQSHMVTEILSAAEYSNEAIESGAVDPACLLEQIELQIARAKEEALSRKEILEKIEKWLAACQEESWLEEYNRDDNRYTAGRGAHLTLKRAEKARVLVNKIPAMVETLTSKATGWEKERGLEFLYDGSELLSMLKQYSMLRQEKEQEKQRHRDHKKFQGQLLAEKEVLYGSKHSASKSGKKVSDRKMSLGGPLMRNQKIEKAALHVLHPIKKGDSLNQRSSHQQYSGVEALSFGRRGSEFSGHSVKNQPSTAAKAREMESPLIRKPLSPVSSKVSSKANTLNFLEDQKRQQKKNIESVHLFKEVPIMSPSIEAVPLFSEVPIMTPSKPIIVNDEENSTPKTMPIQVPPTPSTILVHTLTATPATPFTSGAHNKFEKSGRQVEYSFEEVRAGFNRPKSYNAGS
ncbi:putative microtubule-associated protein, MAP65/Ase1/PRC1 [Rosa chinensis]|uniref:Putative microtubule-associated protein, MAP65/Ase1/PRC1 n=1 Tax=Rosa chinensis TaxID=74649 RepID=A0A2P6SG40_ROSCH|nr:65-kDa microtubule-associated protein 9 [Rosa chinensis]PRQ57651.1 putative microtubule-associated protein, MAP65/Ase1/PRC1 [Rosa chinensis]